MGPIVIFIILAVAMALIWKGSDWITDSLAPVAKKLGTSYVAVTTLIVSFAISTPEIFSSVYTALLGQPTIGIGIIVGSVMSNIGLTVGLSAAFKPLQVDKGVVIRDGVFMVIIAVIILLLGADLTYQRSEGIILLMMFLPYAMNVWYSEKVGSAKNKKEKVEHLEESLSIIGGFSSWKLKASVTTFFIGAAILIVGSYLFSLSLIEINQTFGLPELVVGLFGAVATALPNIAAAIQGTRKGYKDVAITETFGSNIFTMLITLGIIILISPLRIANKVFYFDLNWMIIINALMIAFIFKGYHYKEDALTRYEGVSLVLFYIVLLVVNILFFE